MLPARIKLTVSVNTILSLLIGLQRQKIFNQYLLDIRLKFMLQI